MLYKSKIAFSLVEIMVTITIVAILSVVAFPKYTLYIQRSKVAKAVVILREAQKAAMTFDEENGGYSSTNLPFEFDGITIGTTNTNYNKSYVYAIYTDHESINNARFICITLDRMGLEGQNTTTGSALYSQICVLNTIKWQSNCGSWGNTNGVKEKYLPRGCTCTTVSSNNCS